MESAHILLRPWCEADAPRLFELASDPQVGPRAGWPPHQSEAESLHIIRSLFLDTPASGRMMEHCGFIPTGEIATLPADERPVRVLRLEL